MKILAGQGRRTVVAALLLAALCLTGGGRAGRAAAASQPAAGSQPLVTLLCYHDLSDSPTTPYALPPEFLRSQIRDARAAGWTFLRLSEVLRRVERGEALPSRVMVLTFDDGYRSFLDRALPILREERVPATLAVIGSFTETAPPDMPPLLSWSEIAALETDGLVEIASHSHDLHRWVTSNPYRDSGPSVTTRRYLIDQQRYENREEYRTRIRQDMAAAQEGLRRNLGHDAAVYVWPYGEHDEMARALAAEAGFRWTLSLGHRPVGPEDWRQATLPRVLVTRKMFFGNDRWLEPAVPEVRAAQVDLDPLFDADVTRFRRNVDALVARVHEAGATHVILQACPDPRGDGMLRQAYFANHQIPVKSDIWSMVAAKLHQVGIKVWIRAPVMNLSWAWKDHPEWRIRRDRKLRPRERGWYYRLAPDLPEVRKLARDFYADIAVYLPIDGVLFDDDAYMLPNELLGQSRITDPAAKSEAMREMIGELMRTVRSWRPQAQFARNMYALVAEHEGVYPTFAQDFGQFLQDYDFTVVMAYAHMEGHGDDAAPWVRRLVGKTLDRWTASGPAPVLFKLQAYDWVARRWLNERELRRQVLAARQAGAAFLGVYPVFPVEGSLPAGLLSGPPPTPAIGQLDYSQPALRKRTNSTQSIKTIKPTENG